MLWYILAYTDTQYVSIDVGMDERDRERRREEEEKKEVERRS